MPRVVITGLGAVTPIGLNVETFWSNLIAGKVGIDHISTFDASNYQCKYAAEIRDFDPTLAMDKKEARRYDKFTHLAVAAAKEAIEQSGLLGGGYDPTEIGCIIGNGIGGFESAEEAALTCKEKGNRKISPFTIPRIICNTAAGITAITFGLQGPCTCPVTACATGGNAIGDGWMHIQMGSAKAVVVGGSEAAITPVSCAGFCNMQAMTGRTDGPLRASIPFDVERDGFVMGEGAGVLVLEEYEAAKRRGAPILAELLGYGITCDAFHITAPASDSNGAIRAVKRALAVGGVAIDEVDYVNAHGTSTPLNDKLETQAVKAVFGAHAKSLLMSSNKGQIGHTIGAAGAIEAVATIKTLMTGIVPPTMGLEKPDPELDLDYVPREAREKKVRAAISNSFGFGGHNVCLAFGRV
jgi:3-oxoacyl-[acyl-carrier-protein] synthase II